MLNRVKYIRYIVVFYVLISIVFSSAFIRSDEATVLPFDDVTRDDWYYDTVYSLYNAGILDSDKDLFDGENFATRCDTVLYLYRLHLKNGGYTCQWGDVPFDDVEKSGEIHDAIAWAYYSGIVNGRHSDKFDPKGQILRDELCTIVIRYMKYAGLRAPVSGTDDPFEDSMTIRDFARSHVVAAKLAGIVNGDGSGYLRPLDPTIRSELCKIVLTVMNIHTSPADLNQECVNIADNAYIMKYDDYKRYFDLRNHIAYVWESDPVDISYFDDAAFVGDSVTMSLQYYCAASKALGGATFLSAGSLSPLNANNDITADSKHPIYNGVKMKVEDAVKACGANKVYIMLGINGLYSGVDNCANNMISLIDRIIEKSPDVTIIIQSVTPMTADSPILSSRLNNAVINQYNAKMLEVAQERGWFYVNVAEAVVDDKGNLNKNYCSDPKDMGIHFKFDADKIWVDYLRSHAPRV